MVVDFANRLITALHITCRTNRTACGHAPSYQPIIKV
jgi:hypothetical protein